MNKENWINLTKEPDNIPDFDERVLVYYTLPKDGGGFWEYKIIGFINCATEGKGYKRYEWVDENYQNIEPTHWQHLPNSPQTP